MDKKIIMPAISIIVAAYNAEETISKCLDSVLCQSFSDFELIVIDDGSFDRTSEIIDDYALKDARVKIIHQKNLGAGLAKNVGLTHVSGKYVTFVDSDDWIEPNTLEEIYRGTKDGSIDLVIYNHNKIFSDKIIRNVRKIKEELINLDEIGIEKYVLKYMISFTHEYGAWNKLVKTEILKKYHIGFTDNKKTVYDDNLYCLKLLCHVKTIQTINQAFYNYTIHEGSISNITTVTEKIALGYTEMLYELRDYVQKNGMWEAWEGVFPLLYYSMVFFGLTRMKHFGKGNIKGVGKKLSGTKYYLEYMEQINKLSKRLKYITVTLPGVGTIRNWQLIGLLILTIVQGKLIAYNAIKGRNERVDFWI